MRILTTGTTGSNSQYLKEGSELVRNLMGGFCNLAPRKCVAFTSARWTLEHWNDYSNGVGYTSFLGFHFSRLVRVKRKEKLVLQISSKLVYLVYSP